MGDGRLFLKDGRGRSVQGGGVGGETRKRRGMCFKTSDVAAFPLFLILPVSPIPILSGRMSGGGGEEWRRRRRMSDIRPLVLCFLRVREEKTHKVPFPTNFIPRNCEGIYVLHAGNLETSHQNTKTIQPRPFLSFKAGALELEVSVYNGARKKRTAFTVHAVKARFRLG